MTHRSLADTILLGALLLTLSQCATQIAPPGGPADVEPPFIVRTVPDTNATRFTGHEIELEFNEYVERRSVEESVFISPPLGTPEYDWSGKEVTLLFADTLRRNTTYVVTIGTDVIDRRANNRMASGFSLAFSTGDSIDRGEITGRVHDADPEGVMIFAYRLDDLDPDTLNPSRLKPHYVMQTGKNGTFRITNLAMGRYRVIAVEDEYRNLLYDREVDRFGIPALEVVLTPDAMRFDGLSFRMSRDDTTAPFISGVRPANRTLVTVAFNEALDSVAATGAYVTILDTLAGQLLEVTALYQNPIARNELIVLLGSFLEDERAYLLRAEGVRDSTGIEIDSAGAGLLFTGTGTQDTVPPSFRMLTVADTSRGLGVGDPIEIAFTEPVGRDAAEGGIALLDSANNGVEVDLVWTSPARLKLKPRRSLLSASWYTVAVTFDSLRDAAGNALKDSSTTRKLATFDPGKTGEIEGIVVDQRHPSEGRILVRATRPGAMEGRGVWVSEPGPFLIDHLPEGKYVLSAYRDSDSSGSYTHGFPFPWKPSERFVVGSDTVRVRARWGVEGLRLVFP